MEWINRVISPLKPNSCLPPKLNNPLLCTHLYTTVQCGRLIVEYQKTTNCIVTRVQWKLQSCRENKKVHKCKGLEVQRLAANTHAHTQRRYMINLYISVIYWFRYKRHCTLSIACWPANSRFPKYPLRQLTAARSWWDSYYGSPLVQPYGWLECWDGLYSAY